MALQSGEKMGPYEVIGQIGTGGMATVYKAYHEKLDRHVSIKLMHQGFQDDPHFHSRFQREARIVARLEHPNIVPIYDFSEHNGRPYLVMKIIEGQTLKTRMVKKGISINEINDILMPVAQALDYAHQQGVLHRDIKPSNILIDSKGTPYLTDFGLARITAAGESTMSSDMMLGTPHYISPEQARGERNLDSRTDIYGMGVILFEMLVGRVPFVADTPYAIVHNHIYTEAPLPSSINPDLTPQIDAVLMRALDKDPAKRYATAAEMMQDFNRAVEASGLSHDDAYDSRADLPIAPPAATTPKPSQNIVIKKHKGKDVQVDFNLDMSQMDFSQFGKKVEEGIRKGVDVLSNVASQIEERFEEEGVEINLTNSRRKKAPLTEEEKIRRRVEERLKQRGEFFGHVAAYVGVNLMLWGIWAFTSFGGFPWPFIPMMGWGIGLFFHWVDYTTKHGRGAQKREAMIQREMEREFERSQVFKLKNERKSKNEDLLDVIETNPVPRNVRLTEDGELTDSFIEDMDDFEQRGAQKRQ